MVNDSEPNSDSAVDAPIERSDQDVLGRAPVAHQFAASVRTLDARQGLVIGVIGPWGHGKSSFVNLMREEFSSEPTLTVIDFNPWMFSGSEQLMTFFFRELSAELNVRSSTRFGQVADWLAEYAGVLRPVASFIPIPGATFVADALAGGATGAAKTTKAERSVTELRKLLHAELRKLDRPIVVVIDDIDRLSTSEIREMFKLVRLTANFPNVIYLLAFDRVRVERALSEEGIPGREYLEKIVQLSFDLPQAPDRLRRARIFEELNRVLAPVADQALDPERWSDAYWEIIDPLLRNMRDVTRFALSSRSVVAALGSEVDLVDVLALEAVRVFRPVLLQRLADLRTELTSVSGFSGRKDDDAQKRVDLLVAEFPDDWQLLSALVERLFPAAQQFLSNQSHGRGGQNQWRASHRVAHIDYFNLYLDRVAPEELTTFRAAEAAFAVMGDLDGLTAVLESSPVETLEDVIQGLEAYEDRFTRDTVIPTTAALLNVIDRMPERKDRGFFDLMRPDLAVSRIIVRLFRRIEEEADRERLAADALKFVTTYSSELLLINNLGHREGVGGKHVSEDFARSLLEEFAHRVASSPTIDPSREWDAWRVFDTVKDVASQTLLGADTEPATTVAVVRSVKSTARAHTDGTRHIRSEERLAWELLVDVFGGEGPLGEALETAATAYPDDPLLVLAKRYLKGWRPADFDPFAAKGGGGEA